MESSPLTLLFSTLAVLLVLSGFFSMSETAMMAANRHRLRHRAQAGRRGAQLALALLDNTDKLLGVILLGNTLINAAAATLTGYIALEIFGDDEWALEAGTLFVTFALLIISEITPKVVGAAYADAITPVISHILAPLLRLLYPVVWFLNLFVSSLLHSLRLDRYADTASRQMSPEELRTLVLEASHFIPQKHHSILLNLFDLNTITVEDVMTPRAAIEAINLAAPWEEILNRLSNTYHTRLPLYREDPGNVIGLLHLRRIAHWLQRGELDMKTLLANIQEPYFIPANTPVLSQLQFFQENRQRCGMVVDEYGELLGFMTLEDILEEIIGEFTTSASSSHTSLNWGENDSLLVEGSRSLREINRKLALDFPLLGPKTLNGLILEHFEDIPESGISLRIAGVTIEIVQTQDKSVKVARLYRPSAQ